MGKTRQPPGTTSSKGRAASHATDIQSSDRLGRPVTLPGRGGSRAERSLADSELELALHNRIAEVFLTVDDEQMYERVLAIILEFFDSRHGVFGFIDREGSLVCPSMTRDIFEQCQVPGKSIVFPRDTWGGIWGTCLTETRSVLSNSPGNVPDGHIAIGRSLFVPLVDRGKLIGLIAVANRPSEYTDEDREMLEKIAGHIAPILHARLARDSEEWDRLRVEGALRASERRYRAVVEDQTEFVIRITADGTVTFANEALCRLVGIDRDRLIGTSFPAMLSKKNRRATERHLASLTKDEPTGELDLGWAARDGQQRWLSWRTKALFDDRGALVEYQAVGRDITELNRAAEELRRALSEKEALLREVHHRVKNNMAVISSMLSLQGRRLSDPGALQAIATLQNRIKAMALIHEQLYRSGDFRMVDLGEYVESLVQALVQVYSEQAGSVGIRTRIADVAMAIDVAIPCGLILNELVSNSLEHGFPDGATGAIDVTLDIGDDGHAELWVRDNGVGAGHGVGDGGRAGLGLQLIDLLAKQLGGDVQIEWDRGAETRVRFPVEDRGPGL